MKSWSRALMILSKLTKLAGLLKVVKAAKPLIMVGSMAFSVIAYAFAMGSWLFAFGFVGLLLIHEMGHVAAAYRRGIKASLPVFIPFIGAAIFIKKFDSIRSEAYVAVAGPLIGGAFAFLLAVPYMLTGGRLWAGMLYLGIILNFFNMIPLRPLDGGRMTAICGSWFRALGFAMLFAVSIIVRQPIMLYIWILVLSDMAMPLWWRPVIAVVLSIAMAALMIAGFSEQPWFVDALDCVLVAFMCAVYWADEHKIARGEKSDLQDTFTDEHIVTGSERAAWAAAWLAMCVVFAVGVWFAHGALMRGMP